MATHVHGDEQGRPVCDLSTKKACEERFAQWQATQQVLLAYGIAKRGATKGYKKDKGQFAQLVRVIAGEQEDFMNEDGNPSLAPWVVRLRTAIAGVIADGAVGYNLYTPSGD